jgi:hypothetical protein
MSTATPPAPPTRRKAVLAVLVFDVIFDFPVEFILSPGFTVGLPFKPS